MNDRNKWYWICQLSGWILYFLFGILMMLVFMESFSKYLFANQVVITIVMFFCTHFLRKLINRYEWYEKYTGFPLGVRLLGSIILLASIAQVFISLLIIYVIRGPESYSYKLSYSIGYLANTVLIFVIWISIYTTIKFIRRYKQSEIEKLETQLELQRAEVIALKAQINPHFLFNTLNVVRSLISIDTEKARISLTKLSNLLRYAIRFQGEDLVTFEEELEIVKGYVHLEKIQLEERLQMEWDIDESLLGEKIPAMTLQVLVENAIKHGIAAKTKGGLVRVIFKKEGGQVNLSVINTGTLDENAPSTHESLGLKNIQSRIRHLLGEKIDFTLEQLDNEFVKANLTWNI